MRLAEQIAHFLGRVELVLAGVDDAQRDGERALEDGDAMRARARAHAILARLPGSPLGLALLADACEVAGLDAEFELTLEELAPKVASRADVWVRLARARTKTGRDDDAIRDAFTRAIAVAESGSDARQEALVGLAELDLAHGDGARAQLWLERSTFDGSPAFRRAFAEARLLQGDAGGALARLDTAPDDPMDAKTALVRGRAFAALGRRECFTFLLRAAMLDAPGASASLSSALAFVPSDATDRERIRLVVEDRGESAEARWRAAFARAEGRATEATRALADAVTAGELGAVGPLFHAALEDENLEALALALAKGGPGGPDDEIAYSDARALSVAVTIAANDTPEDDDVARAFRALLGITHPRVVPWAETCLRRLAGIWIPAGAPAHFGPLLSRLDAHARVSEDLDAVAGVYALSGERSRPVRVAIVGEFNAGKSTFINALIGADVAPTGVLPTTATLHHVRYAPDRFARIVFVAGHTPPERIVPTDELRATLRGIDVDAVVRVEILLPLESLTRVEIIDTPGFNAPDARHTRAARSAFEEADFAIWLLDATQAMKGTERAILDEARAADLPVQVLVNKVDRLSDSERGRVMALVDDGLVGMGLTSWRPPIALSARGALAALLATDADTRDEGLRSSGWSDVLTFVQDHVVARSAEVKERALRRRARALVARILARTDGVARERDEREAARTSRAHAFTQSAVVLERDVDARARDVVRALERPFRELARDLTVLAGTRRADGPGAITPDATKEKYREGRCLAHLALPLAEILATFAPHAARLRGADLLPMARQLVRGFASGSAELALGDGSGTLPDAFGRAAVLALADEMLSRATHPMEPSALVGVRREIRAFATALA